MTPASLLALMARWQSKTFYGARVFDRFVRHRREPEREERSAVRMVRRTRRLGSGGDVVGGGTRSRSVPPSTSALHWGAAPSTGLAVAAASRERSASQLAHAHDITVRGGTYVLNHHTLPATMVHVVQREGQCM
mgnify:CR=1 FL=1